MFDGVTGTTAVTLTAKRTAAAAPIPARLSRPERDEQRPAGAELDRPGAELRRRRRGRRGAGRGRRARPARTWIRAPCMARAEPRQPAAAAAPGQHAARSGRTSRTTSGTKLKAKSFWVLRVEERRGRDDDHPEQHQGDEVEQRLRDQRPEQDRERLPHRGRCGARARAPAPARRGGPAGSPTSARRSSSPRSRRGGGPAGWAARRARSSTRRRRGRRARATIRPEAIRTQVTSERTMLSTTLSTPILRAASAVRPIPSSAGDAERRPGGRRGARGCRAGQRRVERGQPLGRHRRAAVGRAQAGPVARTARPR